MEYFTIDELCKSDTAIANGIDNTPTAEVIINLTRLVNVVLDPLRKSWGAPLYVNSGYRCLALNKLVGGAVNSHHVKGMAADITAGSRAKNKQLFKLFETLKFPFTQLIWEKGGFGGPDWVHISYDPNDIRKQVLRL